VEERESLERNCKKYDVSDKFHLILSSRELRVLEVGEFLDQVKRGIIELIYFVKEEIRYYVHQKESLTETQGKRYRQLVLLIHHLNMFILLPRIFPEHFDPTLDYDTERFEQNEQYPNPHAFNSLAREITDIIGRFEN
jgi:hypothetical protein